ncbi:hypothetical protein [Cupriavidus necator]|uniref:hypothetical protein n=1 Tax=Cupriavidus necator TaxID=106590 RepID=UPI0005B41EA6|nr:hypothetical protein [Cupriavidus necator]
MDHQQARADIAAQLAHGQVESFCEGDDAIRHLSKLFIVRNTRRGAGESDAAYAVRVGSLLTDMLDAIGQVLIGANVKHLLADAAEKPMICATREASLLAVSREVARDVLLARGVA